MNLLHAFLYIVLGSFIALAVSHKYDIDHSMAKCKQRMWEEGKASPGYAIIVEFYGMPKKTKPNLNAISAYNDHQYMECMRGNQ